MLDIKSWTDGRLPCERQSGADPSPVALSARRFSGESSSILHPERVNEHGWSDATLEFASSMIRQSMTLYVYDTAESKYHWALRRQSARPRSFGIRI